MRNVPHSSYHLNIRNIVGGTVQGALGGVALLEEVHHWGVRGL